MSRQVVEGLGRDDARKHVGRGHAGKELQIACVIRRRSVLGAVADQGEQPGPVFLCEQPHSARTPQLCADQNQFVPSEVTVRNAVVPARVPDVD
jgi:hypothetical protein